MKTVGIVLDLDDTLLGTSVAYYKAVVEAMSYTIRVISPYMIEPQIMVESYYAVSQEVHAKKRAGEKTSIYPVSGAKELASTDFPAILTESFATWCMKANYRPTQEDMQKVYAMGTSILTHNYEFLPNAKALINMLRRKPDTSVFLVTRGHKELQLPKINRPEFDHFERLILLDFTGKKLEVFKKLQEEYDNIDNWYVIGDDINVDINPALACRMRAVLVTKAASHIAKGEVINIGNSLDYFTEVYDLQEAIEYLRKQYARGHVDERFEVAV